MSSPDHADLVELLAKFGRVVDTCGYVTLTSEQARVLRSLGFPDAAGAGRWKVPTLPVTPEALPAIRNPLQQSVAVERVPPRVARPRLEPEVRDHPRPETPPEKEPSSTEEAGEAEEARTAEVVRVGRKILKAIEKAGGQIPRRLLQQKLHRFPAAIFHEALNELARRGLIGFDSGYVVALPTPVIQGLCDAG